MSEVHAIRSVMQDCAESWNSQTIPTPPFFAAAQFLHALKRRAIHYDTYIQTVITGGGHTYDPSLTAQEGVARNVESALRLADTLHEEKVIDLRHSTEAAAMPFIESWQQDDWMTFWAMVIAKPDFEQYGAHNIKNLQYRFDQAVDERVQYGGLDMDAYRDRTTERRVRLMHYCMHMNAVYESLLSSRVPIDPVNRVVSLFGHDESVGSRAEKFFAGQLGISTFQPVLAEIRPLPPEKYSDPIVGAYISRLRGLGMKALMGDITQQFVLIENREMSYADIHDPTQPPLF